MPFSNTDVDIASLPAAEQTELHPIHPTYRTLLRIEWAITAGVLAIVTAALLFFLPTLRQANWWIIPVGAYGLLVTFYLLAVERSFRYKAYAVREQDIMYRHGWIVRSLKICPFNRIQNCSVNTGPLERKFGLASLTLFTAGSQGADLRIPGLLQEEADRLRHFVLTKINTEHGPAH